MSIFIGSFFAKNTFVIKLSFTFLIYFLTTNLTFAQNPNYPVGNPTAMAGAGNAVTDSDNFLMRNNIAGLTEIPLNDEEEISRIKIKDSKGLWRFNGEFQLLAFRHLSENFFFSEPFGVGKTVTKGTSLTPNFAGEITYTSSNHRFGFGVGTYQTINLNGRFLANPNLNILNNMEEVRFINTDIVAGGALRLSKKLSVGLGVIFSKGSISNVDRLGFTDIKLLIKEEISGVGAPRANIGIHYRPIKYLSLGINYKSRRKYVLSGERIVDSTIPNNPNPNNSQRRDDVSSKIGIPSMLEAGIEVKPFSKLLLACDFRYFDYTVEPFFGRNIYSRDIQSYHAGLKYSLSNRTNLLFGITTSCENLGGDCVSSRNSIGTGISGGVSHRFKKNTLSIAFTAFPGDTRESRFFKPFDNSKERGLLISVGLKTKY